MTWVLELLRKAARMLRPWPGHRDRKAAISAARQEKEHSLARAEHAADVERQIRHLVRDNHFADAIADQIISTYRDRRGGH
jgi:hypothetical protein